MPRIAFCTYALSRNATMWGSPLPFRLSREPSSPNPLLASVQQRRSVRGSPRQLGRRTRRTDGPCAFAAPVPEVDHTPALQASLDQIVLCLFPEKCRCGTVAWLLAPHRRRVVVPPHPTEAVSAGGLPTGTSGMFVNLPAPPDGLAAARIPRTQRNSMLLVSLSGLLLFRFASRALFALLFHALPRRTRYEPLAGPHGSLGGELA